MLGMHAVKEKFWNDCTVGLDGVSSYVQTPKAFQPTLKFTGSVYIVMWGGAKKCQIKLSKSVTGHDLRSRIGAGRFRSNFDPILQGLVSQSSIHIEVFNMECTHLQEQLARDMDRGASIFQVGPLPLGIKPDKLRISWTAHPSAPWDLPSVVLDPGCSYLPQTTT